MRKTRVCLAVLYLVTLAVYNLPVGGTPLRAAQAQAWPGEWVADSAFYATWARADQPLAAGAATRSWLWGPAPFAVANEQYAESYTGSRLVEYLDKARMEINDPHQDRASRWFVTTGLLVYEMVTGQVQTGNNTFERTAPAEVPVAGDAGSDAPTYASFAGLTGPAQNLRGAQVSSMVARDGSVTPFQSPGAGIDPKLYALASYDEVSKHNVPAVFRDWMAQRGPVLESGRTMQGALMDPVYVLGRPITEPYWARVPVSGKQTVVLVQLFERRALTYNPANPPAWQVEMANAGRAYYDWRYKDRTPGPAVAAEVDREGVVVRGWNWPAGKAVRIELDLADGAQALSGPSNVTADAAGHFSTHVAATPELTGALAYNAKVLVKAQGEGQASAALPVAGKALGGQTDLEGTITQVSDIDSVQPVITMSDRDGAPWTIALASGNAVLFSEGSPASLGQVRPGTAVAVSGIAAGSKITANEVRLLSVSATGATLSLMVPYGQTVIRVSGTGWPAERQVSFTLGVLRAGGPPPLGMVRADSRGNIAASLPMPRGDALPEGALWLFASATTRDGGPVQVALPLGSRSGGPPLLYLEAHSGEQMGGLGSYCWGGLCADTMGLPLPPATLPVSPGEVLALRPQLGPDPNAGPGPSSFSAQVFDPKSGRITEIGGVSYFAPTGEPVHTTGDVPGWPLTVALPQGIAPGRYALVVFATWAAPTDTGDASYGFLIEVR